jgi:hypothetical protein
MTVVQALNLWRATDDAGRAYLVRAVYQHGGQQALEELAAAVRSPWPTSKSKRLTWHDLWTMAGMDSYQRARNRRRRGRVRPEPWRQLA